MTLKVAGKSRTSRSVEKRGCSCLRGSRLAILRSCRRRSSDLIAGGSLGAEARLYARAAKRSHGVDAGAL